MSLSNVTEDRSDTLSNDCAFLKLYKRSQKGTVHDYCISFKSEQQDIAHVVSITKDLFLKLISKEFLKSRLVAKVCFIHFNNTTNETEERYYHFPSYQSELVTNAEEFYQRHMEKIASRLESFNNGGSNLVIKNIEHIHILLSNLSR